MFPKVTQEVTELAPKSRSPILLNLSTLSTTAHHLSQVDQKDSGQVL